MKLNMLCMLALTILANTHHVLSFLTGQATSANGVGAATIGAQQQQQQRANIFDGAAVGAEADADEGSRQELNLETQQQQRNVYDPGDGE